MRRIRFLLVLLIVVSAGAAAWRYRSQLRTRIPSFSMPDVQEPVANLRDALADGAMTVADGARRAADDAKHAVTH